ncbi:MAG: hypothetical protein ACYCSO_07005 [Cuniculiplasma sp.]
MKFTSRILLGIAREILALREMLHLPFEKVIISHCDNFPVLSRKEFEKALILPSFK